MHAAINVIAVLDELLPAELAARDQYLEQSRRLARMGLHRLAERLAHESADETRHASLLIERILFLEGQPTTVPAAIDPGHEPEVMLRNNLAAEYRVAANVRAAMTVCERAGDFVSRGILQVLLDDTEHDHIFWLEQQLGLIDQLGLSGYLQTQVHGGAAPPH
jgi:bacterioferritin